MGYFRQHTIVVTSNSDDIVVAHRKACDIFPIVSELLSQTSNGFRSFFIPPDGNKDSSDTSSAWDAMRDRFIHWMRDYRADAEDVECGGNSLLWVEVQFADDDCETQVLRSRDHDILAKEKAETHS